MRRVTVIELSDGTQRPDERSARAYCDEHMGNMLIKHAHALVRLEKFSLVLTYLEENLPDLARAAQWQAEAREKLQEEDDD